MMSESEGESELEQKLRSRLSDIRRYRKSEIATSARSETSSASVSEVVLAQPPEFKLEDVNEIDCAYEISRQPYRAWNRVIKGPGFQWAAFGSIIVFGKRSNESFMNSYIHLEGRQAQHEFALRREDQELIPVSSAVDLISNIKPMKPQPAVRKSEEVKEPKVAKGAVNVDKSFLRDHVSQFSCGDDLANELFVFMDPLDKLTGANLQWSHVFILWQRSRNLRLEHGIQIANPVFQYVGQSEVHVSNLNALKSENLIEQLIDLVKRAKETEHEREFMDQPMPVMTEFSNLGFTSDIETKLAQEYQAEDYLTPLQFLLHRHINQCPRDGTKFTDFGFTEQFRREFIELESDNHQALEYWVNWLLVRRMAPLNEQQSKFLEKIPKDKFQKTEVKSDFINFIQTLKVTQNREGRDVIFGVKAYDGVNEDTHELEFHGTCFSAAWNIIFSGIRLGVGFPAQDFSDGSAFYTTPNWHVAWKYATKKAVNGDSACILIFAVPKADLERHPCRYIFGEDWSTLVKASRQGKLNTVKDKLKYSDWHRIHGKCCKNPIQVSKGAEPEHSDDLQHVIVNDMLATLFTRSIVGLVIIQ